MGIVWRAVHIHHQHPAAVKIITAEHARKDRFVESFHREVRAVAHLNHPNIISVFDYGEVTGGVARQSDGHLAEGSPYMVMELADSTLAHVDRETLNWPQTHTILTQILDALAHAHARGLIHRDLKPDNVLFVADHIAAGGQLKLSDFGVAYAMNTSRQLRAEDDVITGTPRFMAPEQIKGNLRDQGPWTDLYALGCLVYWLTTGSHLFDRDDLDELLRCHLGQARPDLQPVLEVPTGFAEWTHRLVARDRDQRFERAAEAAAALSRIAGPPPAGELTLTAATPQGKSVDVTIADRGPLMHLWDSQSPGPTDKEIDSEHAEFHRATRAELPKTWRDPHRHPAYSKMSNIGLGLFDLRQIPLVGRHRHRDVLWSALCDAVHTERPHVVMLEGPAGIGKTRQANWLAHRAHEVGVADILSARHSPIEGTNDGIARMFANRLRCTGLPREKILSRVRDSYAADDGLDESGLHHCMALTDLLSAGADPNFDESKQKIRFASPQQRYIVWKRLLERLARRRPLVMVLDDVQWGSDTLQFVEYVLEGTSRRKLSLLIVMTVRSDQLENNPLATRLITSIAGRPLVQRLDVDPLPGAHHRELIENLLKLEPHLAEQVAERTAGHPLFAIQLVGDWVERNLLEPGEEGFHLTTDEAPELPENLRSLLRARIERIVGQRVDDPAGPALASLEMGAILGRDVEMREWRRLCELSAIAPPVELLRRLSVQSLIHISDYGWSFANGALREMLEGIASSQGRLADYHRRCVQMLQDLYDPEQSSLAPRLARHLMAAGEYERTLAPLVEAIEYHRRLGNYERCKRWLHLHRKACRQLALADDDPRRIDGPLAMIHTYVNAWEADEARSLLDECEAPCRAYGWDHRLSQVLWYRSKLARRDGRLEKAIELGQQALRGFRDADDREGIFHCLVTLAWWAQSSPGKGEHLNVEEMADEAEHLARTIDDSYLVASALILRGATSLSTGDYGRARHQFRQALDLSEKSGFMSFVAHCHNDLGVIYSKMNQLADAREHHRQALELKKRAGIGGWHVELGNLGKIHLREHNFQRAEERLRAALKEAIRAGDEPRARLVRAGLAASMAGQGRWEEFDEHFEAVDPLCANSDACPGMASLVETAAAQAQRHGKHHRARLAKESALHQWRELGDKGRIEDLEDRLSSIGDGRP